MKNLLLSLVLLASTTPLPAHQPTSAPISLTPEERRSVGTLFWNKKNASSFAQSLTDAELIYNIDILVKNIAVLQNNLLPENSKNGQYGLMFLGGLATTLYGGVAYLVGYDVYRRHNSFINGTFENAFLSEEKVNDLSSVHFSLKEKKYLRQFKAKNIIIGYQAYWVSQWERKRTKEITSKMSRKDKETLTYYALKETVSFHKERFLRDAFMPALLITATIGIFLTSLYGVIYHEELMEGQLEDCKNLYRIFQNEQKHRLSLIQKPI